jgi:hypothetical protein
MERGVYVCAPFVSWDVELADGGIVSCGGEGSCREP